MFSCKYVICVQNEEFCRNLSKTLYPSGATIPVNISPFHIVFDKKASFAFFAFDSFGYKVDSCFFKSSVFEPSETLWSQFLQKAFHGCVSLCSATDTFVWYVADSIDPFLSYRINAYDEMFSGYPLRVDYRNIGSFSVKNLFNSEEIKTNCMNCHNANKNDMNTFVVQVRGTEFGGTYIYHDGKMLRIALSGACNFTFPAWHPSGKMIAFSTNRNIHPLHYIDSASGKMLDFVAEDPDFGILVYDLDKNFVFSSPYLTDTNFAYSFSCWNSSGTVLYFCRSIRLSLDKFYDFKFDLMGITFDTAQRKFIGKPFMVYPFSKDNVSVTMPASSPCDNFIVVSILPNGTFPSLNKGDLCLVYIDSVDANGYCTVRMLNEINSLDGEKYHCFSSNGRWLVFSSKRINGETAVPFFTYINSLGCFSAPFALPQKDPRFYCKNTFSFAFPSFGKNSVGGTNFNKLLGERIISPKISPSLNLPLSSSNSVTSKY
jgi:hypothetical protein